jgi:sugar O-acyltransferase (sialic acid O-acetyltransferase NeuD family)
MSLIQKQGIDPAVFPAGLFITEAVVREHIASTRAERTRAAPGTGHVSLIVYGAGGHGKSVVELVRAVGTYELVGLLDDGVAPGTMVLGLEVLGGEEKLGELVARGVVQAANAVGGVGDLASRESVFQRILDSGMSCPTLVHPTAFLERSASLSSGIQVFPHAYVGSESSVGFGVIVNTGAVVSHDCRVGDYSNIAPGAILAGGVKVGERVLIGMGVTINLNVRIGSGVRIGNGAVVKGDVPDGGIVRAGTTWP